MKMKLAAIALSATMLSGAAFGMEFDPKFYVGGEAQYNKIKNGKDYIYDDANGKSKSSIRKQTPGVGIFLGSRITENLGVEAGHSFLKQSKKTFTNKNSLAVKMSNPYIDALGYIPVADDIDLIGSIGVGRLRTKVEKKGVNGAVVQLTSQEQKDAKAKTGIRLGAGAQYKFDSNIGARLMVRHQKGNKVVKNVNSVNAGLFYQF